MNKDYKDLTLFFTAFGEFARLSSLTLDGIFFFYKALD